MKLDRRRSVLLAVSCLALLPTGRAPRAHSALATFEELGLHLEVDLPSPTLGPWQLREPVRSLLDLPAELVLEVESQVAMTRIDVLDEAGRGSLGARFTGSSALGLYEVALECEAETLADVLREIPPGEYRVIGTAADGARIQGTVHLAPGFPGLFQLLSPAPGATVELEDALVAWTPAHGAAAYTLEIEDEELGMSFTTRLSPGQTRFQVPASILAAGREYDISLTVSGDTDNELELETSFRTASRP